MTKTKVSSRSHQENLDGYMDDATDTNTSPANRRSNWKSSLCLFLLLLAYLVIGAFIFRATEQAHSFKANQAVRERFRNFLTKNPCVTEVGLHHFYRNVSHFLARGVSLKQRYRLDREGGEVETVWSPTASFAFALSVITTIGYGNIVPLTTTGKLFCIGYALIGLPLMALTLSVFGKTLQGLTKKYVKALGLLRKFLKRKRALLIVQSLITVFLLTTFVVLPSVSISYSEGWWYTDAVYFYVITILTIGFGDVVVEDCVRCGHSAWFFLTLFVFSVFVGMCVVSLLFSASSNFQKKKTMSIINHRSIPSLQAFRRRRQDGPVQVIVTSL